MTLNELFLEYDGKRSRNAALAARRKELLLQENPRLGQLFNQKEDICLDQLKDTLYKPQERAQIAENAREKLAALDREIFSMISPEEMAALTPAFECEICKDTGYDDRGRRKLCQCMIKRVYAEIYGAVAPKDLEGSFACWQDDIFPTPTQQRQAKAVRILAQQYAAGAAEKPLLLFMGSAGLGKTYTMGCIARQMDETMENVLYIGAFSLFQVFHRARLGELIPLEPIYDAEALFIDDLGTEPMTANVTQESLFRLLEHRILKNLPTVLSTNMSSTQLKDRYTEKVTSRLFSETVSTVLRLSGDDLRLSVE